MAVTSSSEVVGIIASLALLAPLVRALHKWHIDVRKTSKAAAASPAPIQGSTANRVSYWSLRTRSEKWDLIAKLSMYLFSSILLLMMFVLYQSRPATSGDVALVGMLVAMIVTTSRPA